LKNEGEHLPKRKRLKTQTNLEEETVEGRVGKCGNKENEAKR
jgi:hypothetical protein